MYQRKCSHSKQAVLIAVNTNIPKSFTTHTVLSLPLSISSPAGQSLSVSVILCSFFMLFNGIFMLVFARNKGHFWSDVVVTFQVCHS